MEKECSKCNQVLPLTLFNKGNAKFGRKSECRVCQGKRAKEYKSRPEVRKRETHLQRKRRKKEPPVVKTIRYLQRKEYIEEWNKKNPEKYRRSRKVREARRRQRKEKAGPLHLSSIVFLESYNLKTFGGSSFTCEYCSSIIEGAYDLEHIVPLCREGTQQLDNLAISCASCNRGIGGKHMKLLEEWRPCVLPYIQKRNNKWKTKQETPPR